jgi:hypothetical protein
LIGDPLVTATRIIETSAGQHYAVRETGDPDLAHVWFGIAVKRSKGAWSPKAKAREILVRKKKDWIALAKGLLEYETLSGEEIKQLIAGQPPARDMGDDTPPSRGSAVPKAGARKEPKKKGGEEPEGGMEPQPQG